MAIGLIKKQIIHSSGKNSSPARFFAGSGNRKRLADAKALFETEMNKYRNTTFTNPFSENVYANMSNQFEDLTVNQKQANLEAQLNRQSETNVLDAIRSGGDFNVGNIQALTNQSQIANQRISANIGQQENANQIAAAQEASRLQGLEAKGELQVQSGEQLLQQQEFDKQSTLLGMSMEQVSNAEEAIAANKAMWGNIVGGVIGLAASDKRLKKNINLIGQSPSGLNIYSFEYKNSMYGKGLFQGVMSDEVPSTAVVKGVDGYDMVDYNMLDVQFKQI